MTESSLTTPELARHIRPVGELDDFTWRDPSSLRAPAHSRIERLPADVSEEKTLARRHG